MKYPTVGEAARPRQAGKPAMDIQIIMKGITDAKELVASVMEEMKRKRER